MILVFKKHHIFKKLLLIGLVSIICFVTSGLGVLALPKKADAIGPVFDIKQILNNLLVSIWKSVIFPLIKEIVVGYITTGEFPMDMDSFKTWLYEDLLFQTLESVVGQFSDFSLCADFSMNVRIALGNELAVDDQPDCTYDQSELAGMTERIIRAEQDSGEGAEALWDEINSNYLSGLFQTSLGSNNQYGAYAEAQERFSAQARRTEDDLRLEVSANRGFLGQRDCSQWEEGSHDLNHDGEMQENECPLQTTGETVAGALEGYNRLEEGSIGSEVFADLIGFLGSIVDLLINKAVSAGISAITGGSTQERSAATEYRQAVETSSQGVGENRAFEH
jgi:hypothetical protein